MQDSRWGQQGKQGRKAEWQAGQAGQARQAQSSVGLRLVTTCSIGVLSGRMFKTIWAHLECVHLVFVKLCWWSIWLERTMFIVFCALVLTDTLYLSSGSRLFNAKSCESIVSVVPVRFALLETLVLSSESMCKAFWGNQAADFRNAKSIRFVERTTWRPPEGGPPTPTHPPFRCEF